MEENYREELDNIEEIVQDYIDGVIEFNFEKAEKSWHAEGVKIFIDKYFKDFIVLNGNIAKIQK